MKNVFRFCSERLASLVKTLELADVSDFRDLVKLANFATLVSTYSLGFSIVLEPSEESGGGDLMGSSFFDCSLHLNCMDASIAIRPVLERFQTVVITSGVRLKSKMMRIISNLSGSVSILFRPFHRLTCTRKFSTLIRL